jgi:hypothetical protein
LDINDELPDVWHLDAKSLYQSLYEWKSGPLQRLLAIYKENLLSAEWKTISGKDMPDALSQAHRFLSKEALQTPFWTQTVAPKIKTKFQEYLGGNVDLSIEPSLNSVDAWILSEFVLNISANNDLPHSNPNAPPCSHSACRSSVFSGYFPLWLVAFNFQI